MRIWSTTNRRTIRSSFFLCRLINRKYFYVFSHFGRVLAKRYLADTSDSNVYSLWYCTKNRFTFSEAIRSEFNLISEFAPFQSRSLYIRVLVCSNTKTCLYNFDPLKPHFNIVKLGFTGVYIIFLISAQKHRLWYSLEPPRRGGSNEYPQSMFWAEIRKISVFFFFWEFSDFQGFFFFIFFWGGGGGGGRGVVVFFRWNFLYIWIGVFS